MRGGFSPEIAHDQQRFDESPIPNMPPYLVAVHRDFHPANSANNADVRYTSDMVEVLLQSGPCEPKWNDPIL